MNHETKLKQNSGQIKEKKKTSPRRGVAMMTESSLPWWRTSLSAKDYKPNDNNVQNDFAETANNSDTVRQSGEALKQRHPLINRFPVKMSRSKPTALLYPTVSECLTTCTGKCKGDYLRVDSSET